MLLRNPADRRTLLWVFVMPIVVGLAYWRPSLLPFLSPLCCYLALAAGVFAHNHNHCPTFSSRRWNAAFGYVISVFYGYPVFAWVPTHNLNHHKLVNRAGDATITWRHTNKHNWLVASTYFFVSAYWQSDPIKDYIRKARATNPRLFRSIVSQYALWGGAALASAVLACALHGIGTGIVVWIFASFVPAFFALWTIMLFNYIQHVHTDPWSEHNHSRNFTGGFLNYLLFNNGFHAVHHENPGAHWSTLPGLHATIADKIDPALKQTNTAWFFIENYVLALLSSRFGSKQIGRAPFDSPDGGAVDLTTAAVPAAPSGTNAAMA